MPSWLRTSRLVLPARNRTLRRSSLAACSSPTATLRHPADPFFPLPSIAPPHRPAALRPSFC